MNISIVYWSGTGNTEKMAEHIAVGAKNAGAEVLLNDVNHASEADVLQSDVIVFGCSSMGVEELEDTEFLPFYSPLLPQLSGKKVALFGSYDWGDGEWMRTWEEEIKSAGATLVGNQGLIVNNTPTPDDEKLCQEFGEKIVSN